MTTNQTQISVEAPIVTLINVFTVAPEKQEELLAVLVEATEEVMCKLPGFISSNIHRSLDGTRVTNYVQWRSVEDFKAIFDNPEATAHMHEVGKIAQGDKSLYRVHSITPAAAVAPAPALAQLTVSQVGQQ